MNFVWFTTKGKTCKWLYPNRFIFPAKSFQSHLMTSQKVPIIKTFSKKKRTRFSLPRVRIETSFETWIFASMVKAATTHILPGGMFSLVTHHPIPSSTPPNITHSQPLPKTSTKVTNVPSFSPGSAASHMADASGKFHFINANTVNPYGSREGTHFEWGRSIYKYIFVDTCIYGRIIYERNL